ncbi:MAG: hypothetical protein K2O54_08100 [Prevotella sp.]|nr:hypothetical protein [Prevotella sp.]
MKKTFYSIVLACVAILMQSCDGNVSSLLGNLSFPADKAESYAKAIENVKEKTDLNKFKIYSVRFCEGEKLSNNLMFVSLTMINPDNYSFEQCFYLDGTVGDMREHSTSSYEVDYEKIKGIDITKLDPEKIQSYFDEAKDMIPEGCTYKSISYYEIEEVLPRKSSSLNKKRDIGSLETEFGVCFTEDGKETETSGGKTNYLYYETTMQVNPDGTLTIKD